MNEYDILVELNEEVDQLCSTARNCSTFAPEVKHLLDLAWYFSEKGLREAQDIDCDLPGVGSCGHSEICGRCQCCHHFAELRNKAEAIRRIL